MDNNDDSTQGDRMLGELIARAGHGPTASPEARERIYKAVRARWQDETRRQPADEARPRVRPEAPRAQQRRSYRRVRLLALAATVAAVAVTLVWLEGTGPDGTAVPALARIETIEGDLAVTRDGETVGVIAAASELVPGDRLRTGSDGRAALLLDDGTMLRLDFATTIRLASSDAVVLDAGAVYVDTGGGVTSRALVIDTPLGDVEHLGTQYEVRLANAGLRVRVREGRVAVRGDAVEAVGAAGDVLEIDSDGLTARGVIAPDDPAWDWASALATLPPAERYEAHETLTWIAREQGLALEYADARLRRRLADETVVGLEGLDPTEALDVLSRAARFEATLVEGRLRIAD